MVQDPRWCRNWACLSTNRACVCVLLQPAKSLLCTCSIRSREVYGRLNTLDDLLCLQVSDSWISLLSSVGGDCTLELIFTGTEVIMAPSPQDVNSALATTAEGAPVTLERPVPTDLKFEKPYMARALKAVDSEHPYGTVDYPNHDLTVLQQHVDFFDTNHDGVIYPWETYSGFRRIGFNIFLSLLAAIVINVAFSYPTVEGWLPSLRFGIYTKNIHKAKHGSDSESYDTEGRFVPSKFEEVFTKYAKTSPDRMNLRELYDMTNAMRNAFDFFGWAANKLEWGILYLLVKDDEGFASKGAIRGVFDGSFFVYIENELNAKKELKAKKA